jgi:primosomal protein N' (replication factor Y)
MNSRDAFNSAYEIKKSGKGLICAGVSVSNISFAVDKPFSYQIPGGFVNDITVGTRVIVPFGRNNKKREGIITDIREYDGNIPLKPIYEIVNNERVLDEKSIELATYISQKYYSTLYDAAALLMPPGSNIKFTEYAELINADLSVLPLELSDLKRFIIDLLVSKNEPVKISEIEEATENSGVRKTLAQLQRMGKIRIFEESSNAHNQKTVKTAELMLPEFEAREYAEQFLKRANAQKRLLELLIENGKMPVIDLVAFSGASRQSINGLAGKGVISITEEVLDSDPFIREKSKTMEKHKLNPEQQEIVDTITKSYENKDKDTSVFLIKGVTGSGKTEVYLELVEFIILKGGQAVILVPEIALTPQIRQRFFGRFGSSVAVLHSALSISERKSQWRKIENGEVSVAVGARSAVFAPFSNLAMIIVDEEHETTYKSENSPRYNAKDIARFRMKQNNGILVLASATPSVENYYGCFDAKSAKDLESKHPLKAKIGETVLLRLNKRYNNTELPSVKVVDMREELKSGNHSVLSEELKKGLMAVRENNQKAIILLNRRGYSTFVSCRDCGLVIKCKKCDVALTYHSIEGSLKCHYCGHTEKLTNICPDCKSTSVRYFGSGTQKLEEELYKMFSDTQIIRMDNDTTSTKMSHERLLTRFAKQDCAILLGTQMIAKGLDFKDVALVGVISADTTLFLGGYNGSEKTFGLITQVCGRAGRGETRGEAVVQTYNPEHYAIIAAASQDYDKFYESEIIFRKNIKYPPFCEIINVIFTGDNDAKILEFAERIKSILTEKVDLYNERENYIAMYGPTPCAISKIRDKYRFHILIKCKSSEKIRRSFSEAIKELIKKGGYDINVAVDVNPVNFI